MRDKVIGWGIYAAANLLAAASFFIFSNFAIFVQFNQSFLDRLHGQAAPRPEIVIVAIDDRSLQEIGAWEWDRDVFAQGIDQIMSGDPAAVGVDVLFLEERDGDEQLQRVLDLSGGSVVLGSKAVDDQILYSVLTDSTEQNSGFVNFEQDSDGIIRQLHPYIISDSGCEVSLSLALASRYFRIPQQELCTDPISLRLNSVPLEDDRLMFTYTKEKYAQVSFIDLYNGGVDPVVFEDKIVLIGSTALDLRTNLNDNFTDIYGQNIPGVQIHANALNSFLNNDFYYPLDSTKSLVILLSAAFIISMLFKAFRKTVTESVISLLLIIAINILGFILFEYGILFPFVQMNFALALLLIGNIGFKSYTQARQNQFINRAFGQYINPELLQEILDNPESLKLGGQKRYMTVLFSDLRGFTTLSESLSSEDLVSLLNDYLNMMSSLIINGRGTIDKYIGDAIMALWNAPLDDDEHELHSVQLALDMVDALAAFNSKNRGDLPELNIGVGINSGDMVVGNIGGEKRFDYTVLGDNVNLSARLEGLTKKYGIKILVTQMTKDAVKSSEIIFRPVDDVIVKGKSESVMIYEPLRKSPENTELVAKYEEALTLYRAGKFAKASEIFMKLSGDKPSLLMLERIGVLSKKKDAKWDGVWVWDEK